MDLHRLLTTINDHGASDLHLQAGSQPMVRIHGLLTPIEVPAVTKADFDQVLEEVGDDTVNESLVRDLSADFAYAFKDVARYRVNVFYEKGCPAIAFRRIPSQVPSVSDLNLPPVVEDIALVERGLVLVTGTTGSGKSSTLAAMIDHRNHSRRNRIITIEDPVEFVHQSDKSLIAQRELGPDARGFLPSLREALRQDPDVILVGELRDAETMRTAVQAADTGHAVYSTVHTSNASQTVQRLIALFPPEERDLLLMQLSANLEAVISQRLARKIDGKGRVPVVEILRDSPVVRKLIAEGRADSLPQAIANRDNGMQLFDQHLAELYTANQIQGREALRLATNPEAVSLAMRGISGGDMAGGLVR